MRSAVLFFAMAALGLGAGGGDLLARERSEADKALARRANKDCNSPHYPSGARAVINYSKGTYRCVETNSSRR
jgi:hypothetical protein